MKSRRSGGDRGGIRKRGPTRTDRDGDMDMDAPGGRGGKRGGRGGPGRPTGSGSGSGAGAGAGRPARSGDRPQARDKTLEAIQKAISNTRDPQVSIRQGKNTAASNLDPFSVRGWKESKVSSHRDGGVENLIAFLERRMNAHSKSGPRARITKVCSTSEGAIASITNLDITRPGVSCVFKMMAKRQPTFRSLLGFSCSSTHCASQGLSYLANIR